MRCKLIALGLLASAQVSTVLAQPVIQAVPERPRIVVDGYGEVKTPPDVATITYTVRGEGPASDDAVRAMTAAGATIEAALRAIDPAAEPHTGDVKVTPVKSDDCKEQDYGSPQLSAGPCAVLGYIARQSITLRTADVKDAGTMVGLVGRGRGYGAQISSFDLRDPSAAKRQATSAALADAASKATTIASASRVTLGPILNISTISRESAQDIVLTGERLEKLPQSMAAPPPVPVKLVPEPITTSANVTVTYAIGQ